MAKASADIEIGEEKVVEIFEAAADAKTVGGPASPSSKPEAGERPPSGMLSGYTQTYLIWKTAEGAEASMVDGDGKEADDQTEHEILFRCGNWCYTGHVVLRSDLGLEDMPVAIPLLQRQQSRLHYYCNAGAIPQQSNFHQPIKLVYAASDFAAQCFSSGVVTSELARLADVYSWVEEDSRNTFFEMKVDPPSYMDNISLVCSKTYARGLIFIAVYCEGSFYFTVSDGEGDQPLLDVKFPDVSHHGQGVALLSQQAEVLEGLPLPPWFISLSLWHSLPSELKICPPPTRNLSTTEYIQMYFIMRPRAENGGFAVTSAYREVLFRFGSWCYGGSVQLTPIINLSDIPHVIPALRMQQSRLEFVYSADQVPATSPYTKPMAYMMQHSALMEREIVTAEDVLSKLVERLTEMGLGDSISSWLEGDSTQSFFEFQIAANDAEAKVLRPVELIASKCYFASGVVLVVIYFQGFFYCVVSEAGAEQPLLDSKFPDVSSKGRGYQIQAYSEGTQEWPALRKVSVWQSTTAMQAEMEARLQRIESAEAAGGEEAGLAVAMAEERAAKATDDELARGVGEVDGIDGDVAGGEGSRGGGGAAATAAGGGGRAAADEKDTDPASGSGERHRSASEVKPSESSGASAGAPDTAEAKTSALSGGGGVGSLRNGAAGGPLSSEAQAKGGGGSSGGGLAPLGSGSQRQSLGAFHRLQPMGGGMQDKLSEIRASMGGNLGAAPWDASGRPMGKGGGLGSSPFGKGQLDFKKGPGSGDGAP